MKTIFHKACTFALILLGMSCNDHSVIEGVGSSVSQGAQVVFWMSDNCGVVTVSLEGQTKQISSPWPSLAAPACGEPTAATFTLPAGTYTYHATCSGYQWINNVTVTTSTCTNQVLTTSFNPTVSLGLKTIRNYWKSTYLGVQNGTLGLSASQDLWEILQVFPAEGINPYDGAQVVLKHQSTGQYLTMNAVDGVLAPNSLSLSSSLDGSILWVEHLGGAFPSGVNRLHPILFQSASINVEFGSLEVTNIKNDAWSAEWSFQ